MGPYGESKLAYPAASDIPKGIKDKWLKESVEFYNLNIGLCVLREKK